MAGRVAALLRRRQRGGLQTALIGRCGESGEALLKEESLVIPRKTLERAKEDVTLLLVEGQGLEIECVQIGRVTPASRRLALGVGEKPSAPPMTARLVGDRKHLDIKPIPDGLAAQTTNDLASVIAEQQDKRFAIVGASVLGVVSGEDLTDRLCFGGEGIEFWSDVHKSGTITATSRGYPLRRPGAPR